MWCMEKVKQGLVSTGTFLSELAAFLFVISIPITFFAAYITHIVNTIMYSQYAFLFLGILLPPIAVINGIIVWFS